jgi:hypothetical protein
VPQLNNPALKRFVAEMGEELVLAQVVIRRAGTGFECVHVNDRAAISGSLKTIAVAEALSLPQFTAGGAFRPLKSSPNLKSGWLVIAKNESELEYVLNYIYPHAIADWFVVAEGNPPITNYREFTGRQTGMYRITTMLDDTQAAQVIRACCDKRFCLKQRLWTVEGLAADGRDEKSLIPCLEPCAVLLEFARKGMRMEQEEKISLTISESDAASLEAALRIALENPRSDIREADFNAAANPRRLQLAVEKLRASGIKLANAAQED